MLALVGWTSIHSSKRKKKMDKNVVSDLLDPSSVKRLAVLFGGVPFLDGLFHDPKVAVAIGLIYTVFSYMNEMMHSYRDAVAAKAKAEGVSAAAKVDSLAAALAVMNGPKP